MVSRRDFLKRAALATAGSALAISNADAMTGLASVAAKKVNVNRKGKGGKMTLRFFPYELKLAHTFTVATYTRTTTPDVQVEIEYEGVTGYGEASMPPYLGQTVQSVTTFLQKVDLSQFKDPFMMDDILNYIDSLSPATMLPRPLSTLLCTTSWANSWASPGIASGVSTPPKRLTPPSPSASTPPKW